MTKITEFLNETSEISNKERLIVVGGTLMLTTIGLVLNAKLLNSRLNGAFKDEKIANLEWENRWLQAKNEVLEKRGSDSK